MNWTRKSAVLTTSKLSARQILLELAAVKKENHSRCAFDSPFLYGLIVSELAYPLLALGAGFGFSSSTERTMASEALARGDSLVKLLAVSTAR